MGYAEERIELLPRLRKQIGGRALLDSLRLDGRELRFHLGTSLADLRVPVHVDAALEATLVAAVRDLVFLLALRHRPALRENDYDQLLMLDGFDPRAARPVSFTPPASVTREGIRRAFLEAPELHPALDSGLVASWIGSGRPGRILVGALNALFKRAIDEGAATEGKEPSPYLALLALRSLAEPALVALKKIPLSPPAGRLLHGAVSAGLLLAMRLAAREAGIARSTAALQCEAALLALPWLGGLRLVPGSGATCYGIPFAEAVPRIDAFAQKLLAGGTPDGVARDATADLLESKDAQRKAARSVALGRLRGDLLQLLRLIDAGKAPQLSLDQFTPGQLFQLPGALERTLSTPSLRKDLALRAKAAARGANNEPARDLLESIALAGREWRDEDPGNFVLPETVSRVWSAAVAALAVDAAIDRGLDLTEGQLVHRTGGESEGGLRSEHESGRLYLFGLEETPQLLSRSRAPQMGHLFCDMKDFTKRTAFLKEAVVADFLSREFYGPILTAAARHQHGAAHLADKGGIYLNNLLGDAVSFSGDIVGLVELTHDIRFALEKYGRTLATEGSSETVARTLASLEEKFTVRRHQLTLAMRSAVEALRKGTLDPESGEEPSHRILALEAERVRLEDERESALALVSGERLEAGVFISFGAAPEVAMFEDAVFGPIKVSIAEKINESARGTARNGGVRTRVEVLLANERTRRGKPDLVCPLSVAVSQPLSMPISRDAEAAVRRALAAGDAKAAEEVLQGTVREFVGRLVAQEGDGDRGDIYNGGAALSEEALTAYVSARGSELIFLRREIEIARLNPALADRYVFPHQSLRMVLGVAPASQSLQELFVFVGRALFKGFERTGGLGVYEMVPRDSPFFLLLAQHHFLPWLREHEEGKGPETGEWRLLELGARP